MSGPARDVDRTASVIAFSLSLGTHRGEVREHNEDAVGIDGWALQGDEPGVIGLDLVVDRPIAVVVSDGMGGHRGGAAASRFVAERLSTRGGGLGETRSEDRLLRAIQETSDLLVARGETDASLTGMGATAVVLLVEPDGTGAVVSVGDSRAYRVVDGVLSRLTIDHRREGGSNVLTQVLGGGVRTRLAPRVFSIVMQAGTRYLLCTDGLTDMLDEDAIASCLDKPASDAVTALVADARNAGGHDNVTVAVIDVRDAWGLGFKAESTSGHSTEGPPEVQWWTAKEPRQSGAD